MKTLIRLVFTSIISTIGLFAALSMTEPWLGYAVSFSAWFFFIWTITSGPRS